MFAAALVFVASSLFSAPPPLERYLPASFHADLFERIDEGVSLHARDGGPVPELSCRSAVLLDAETGTILYAENENEVIPPASMTKLVSLHIIFREIREGRLSPGQEFIVPEEADFRNAPPRSSLMFLQAGQRVTLLDLMRGLALPSGNDAALLVARIIAGSMEEYVAMMNREMADLGFDSIFFADSSGYSERNRTTALDFARFCLQYIRRYPESLPELHSLTSFAYPGEENLTGSGQAVYGTVEQNNHNSLVGRHPWVDGLKTGYIDESGYNVALTAEAGGRRLVAVLMGGPGENARDGDLFRVIDGSTLLAYGFFRFQRVMPALPDIGELPLVGGRERTIALKLPDPEALPLFPEEAASLRWIFVAEAALKAPVERGGAAGTLYLAAGRRILKEYPVTAAEEAPEAPFLRRLFGALTRSQ